MFYQYQHSNLAYYHGKPASTGQIKLKCEDFFVQEVMGFEPSGEGEHEWLFIEKNNLNTQELIEYIAKASNTPVKDIGYSGLKDKQAITQQWLSLYRPGLASIKWEQIEIPNIKILKATRHTKKLKIGTHKQNYFKIVINLTNANFEDIKTKVDQIKQLGFINYFGEQRFGNKAKNGTNARKWLQKKKKISRSKRSLFISTLRSEFFNESLSLRVLKAMWLTPTQDDYFVLQNSNSFFKYNKSDSQLYNQRLKTMDISLSHALIGNQKKQAFNRFENELFTHSFKDVLENLIAMRVNAQQRSIRGEAIDLICDIDEQKMQIVLKFSLSKGQYATSLIRGIINIS